MKKVNTAPISGMQELLPAVQATFDNLKSKIEQVYKSHGYLHIETPVIDRCEILLAKAGGDTEKQIYKVVKTAETKDDADQALRFDHTVPLARYVVEHENDLSFPFKVTQIARNFRGERAQKGRFRELYQCDADVIGRGTLPLYYDYDVIATLIDTFESFKLDTPVLARLNNRKIVTGLIEGLGLKDQSEFIYSLIDHSEKVSPTETEFAMKEANFDKDTIDKLLKFMDLHGKRAEVIDKLQKLDIKNENFVEGLKELDYVMDLLEKNGFGKRIQADMRIVRGLDYYTGTVFEFILPEYKKIGSVCGGGRYENLAGYFTDEKLPGVGGSIGLTRLFYVLNEQKLLEKTSGQPLDYAVVPVTDNELPYATKVAADLRSQGFSTTVIAMPENKRLGDKLNLAAKLSKHGIVIGENEVASEKYEVKDFS